MAVAAPLLLGFGALVSGGAQVYGQIKQGEAAQEQGNYEKQIADYNAKVAEEQARDAIALGEQDVNQVSSTVERTVGSQRVSFAAQGINADMGSAADMQRDTRAAGSQDVLTIRNNAARQAWGYRVQAKDYTMRGQMAQRAGDNAAHSSIATAGLAGIGSVMQAGAQLSKFGSGGGSGGGGNAPLRAPTSSYSTGFGGKRIY